MRLVFDASPCARCLGRGVYATGTCFRCGGAKTFLTHAGRAARARFDRLRDERLRLAPDALVGERVEIPAQFVGPENGGQFLKFKRRMPVLAVRPWGTDGLEIDVRANIVPVPWLQYDEATKVLTIHVSAGHAFYRQMTGDEMRKAAEWIGAGCTLVEDAPVPA